MTLIILIQLHVNLDMSLVDLNLVVIFIILNYIATIVLVFEAPESFEFLVERDSTIKMGEAFGKIE